MTLPLFEGGRLLGNLEARTGEYDEAVESYNQTILNAFSAIASQAARLKALEAEASETAEALRLAIKAMRSPRAAIAPGWGKTWSPRKDMSKRPPRRR